MMKRLLFIVILLFIAVNLGAKRKLLRRRTFSLFTDLSQGNCIGSKRAYLARCSKVKKLKNRLKTLEKKIEVGHRETKLINFEKMREMPEINPVIKPAPESIVRVEPEPPMLHENDVDSMLFPAQESEPQIQEVAVRDSQPIVQPAFMTQVPMQATQYQPTLQNYQMQQMPTYQQQMPMMMAQQQAPVMQPMYQQNLAAVAMQLQASAMAMQAQASALMMQSQQPQYSYAYGPVTQLITRDATKQEKTDQCMRCLHQVVSAGEGAVQRLLLLLDLEFEILEHLLACHTGQLIERSVRERNEAIQTSPPLITAAYDKIFDLATTYGSDDTGARLYHYCVRKSKRAHQATNPQGKKKFLMRVMYELENYYSMIEKMKRDLAVAP